MKSNDTVKKKSPFMDPQLEKPRYVATITYQKGKIRLDGRTKNSPKFETLYGLIYWINKQSYNLEYSIFRTDKSMAIREGFKKVGEVIK